MTRTALALGAVSLVLFTGGSVAGQDMFKSAHHDFRLVTVADGLVNPWSMAWLPGGDMLITERPGRLRIVRDGSLLPDAVSGVPEVFAQGQGGLFDVLPHPDFATNRLLYLSYARPKGDGSTTAVIRGRFENDRLTAIEEIFEAQSQGRGHYGGRLAWDPDGFLFLTVGERMVSSTGDLEAAPRAGSLQSSRRDCPSSRRRPRAGRQPVRGSDRRPPRNLELWAPKPARARRAPRDR